MSDLVEIHIYIYIYKVSHIKMQKRAPYAYKKDKLHHIQNYKNNIFMIIILRSKSMLKT